ncbi:MAG: hypothetical protein C5B45_03535 [Chlamydiae bacterium]|nr:MAG: hypothetical protein C5B45_03535 [Chlamydiota bacterium]
MKNLLKLFSLSIVLCIAGLNAWEKTYVDPEDITFENGTICLYLKNGDLQPITAIYSDEKGVYAYVNQDDDQNAEPDVLCIRDNQDELNQPTEQEILSTQIAQEALAQSTEQEAMSTQNQPTEQKLFYTQDNQDALDQTSKEKTLCTQNVYRELMAGYECPSGSTVIH